MEEKTDSGYKGSALKAIQKSDIEIGDIIRITKEGQVYEGILIPRSEYGDDKHLVIKLKNGYNVGIDITDSGTRVEKTGKGTKPKFARPVAPSQNLSLPKVVIISTGGTIASRVDYRTGAVRPALSADDLYSVVPELADIAQIEAKIFLSVFSENLTCKEWGQIAEASAGEIEKGADGIVIAHGTDTLGYTAAALSFALQNLPVPVVLVGSQRSADRPSSDAASNLIGAVTTAARAPFAGVVVAMHETPSDNSIALHRGTKVRKCHTSRRDAFRSVNAPLLARIQDQNFTILDKNCQNRETSRKLILKPNFDDRAALIKFYPGMNPDIVTWHEREGYRGLILEGTGLGHVSKRTFETLGEALGNGTIVAMASQCVHGRVNMNVYEAGRDLLKLGVIPLEDMLAETALVKLMWILGQTTNAEEAKSLLRKNLIGEISPRTVAENGQWRMD